MEIKLIIIINNNFYSGILLKICFNCLNEIVLLIDKSWVIIIIEIVIINSVFSNFVCVLI